MRVIIKLHFPNNVLRHKHESTYIRYTRAPLGPKRRSKSGRRSRTRRSTTVTFPMQSSTFIQTGLLFVFFSFYQLLFWDVFYIVHSTTKQINLAREICKWWSYELIVLFFVAKSSIMAVIRKSTVANSNPSVNETTSSVVELIATAICATANSVNSFLYIRRHNRTSLTNI